MNDDRKKYVILFGFSEGMGLTYHLADMAIALNAELAECPAFEFHLVSIPGEQQAGQWDAVAQNIDSARLHEFDNLMEISLFLDTLAGKSDCEKVIVLTQGLKQLRSMVPLKRKHGKRFFIDIRLNSFRNGSWYRPLFTLLLSFILTRYCDSVNFQSDYATDIFLNSGRVFRAGIGYTIPLGCSTPPFIPPRDEGLKKLFEDEQLVKFVYLAQFHPHKSHMWLLDALKEVLGKNDNVRVVFLGDGSLIGKVKARVDHLRLSRQVLCPGRIDRAFVPWILDQADCALVASRTETFGHNFLEPMFFGTPVIGTDVGIGREIVRDYQTGFLIKSTSKVQLRKAVEFSIRNPEKLKCYGANAQALVRDAYSWQTVARRYVDLFRSM